MCHLRNDSPDLGWSAYVVTDADRGLAETLAEEPAERAWALRREPPHPADLGGDGAESGPFARSA